MEEKGSFCDHELLPHKSCITPQAKLGIENRFHFNRRIISWSGIFRMFYPEHKGTDEDDFRDLVPVCGRST